MNQTLTQAEMFTAFKGCVSELKDCKRKNRMLAMIADKKVIEAMSLKLQLKLCRDVIGRLENELLLWKQITKG